MKTSVRIIGHFGGYRKMFSFGWTCLVYHATTLFCSRNYNYKAVAKPSSAGEARTPPLRRCGVSPHHDRGFATTSYKNDALGKTVGQMVGAARSARQNIVEASSERRCFAYADLAKSDVPTPRGIPRSARSAFRQVVLPVLLFDGSSRSIRRRCLDRFESRRRRYSGGRRRTESVEILRATSVACVHSHVIRRAIALLVGQMQKTADDFTDEGGFTERLSKARLEVRDARVAAEGTPKCPKCGGPMRKMVAKKGRNAGNPFWSCQGYPECDGTRNFGR